MKRFMIILLSLIYIQSALLADAFRTNIVGVISVSADRPEGSSLDLRYNDAIGIVLADSSPFIQALEFELRIPRQFAGQESSVAWALYSRVNPMPAVTQLDYIGTLLATQPLPSRVSFILQLPVKTDHRLRASPFLTLIPQIVQSEQFPLLFKLLPAGKGLSAVMAEQQFRLIVRPVLTEEGLLTIQHPLLNELGEAAIRVYINDRQQAAWTKPMLLAKGLYNVRISVDNFRDEVYSVIIEPGKVFTLSANPSSNAPSVSFEVPQGTKISLNGTVLDISDKQSFTLEVGEHTIECTIGDYTLVRKFSVVRGRQYKVVMSVDLQIKTE